MENGDFEDVFVGETPKVIEDDNDVSENLGEFRAMYPELSVSLSEPDPNSLPAIRFTNESGDLILSRFRHNDAAHEMTRNMFFTDEAKRYIGALINTCHYPMWTRDSEFRNGLRPVFLPAGHQVSNISELDAINIRFASFYVDLSTHREAFKIYLIRTLPNLPMVTIDYCTLYKNLVIDTDSLMLRSFISKIVQHLKVIGAINDVGTVLKHTKYFFSFDLYYNRNMNSSGIFHSDNDVGNDVIFLSLEFMLPPGIKVLGTELLESPHYHEQIFGTDRVGSSQFPNALVGQIALRTTSLRVEIDDNNTLLFNNKATVHATPFAGPLQVPLKFGNAQGVIMSNPFAHHHHRIEIREPDSVILRNTFSGTRTFMRTHVSSVPEKFDLSPYAPQKINFAVIQFYVDHPNEVIQVSRDQLFKHILGGRKKINRTIKRKKRKTVNRRFFFERNNRRKTIKKR